MREIENIALDLCCLYYSCKAPIDSNGKLNYFLAGSLAILPLLCADKIEDVIVDENNMVVSIENCQQIDETTRTIFQQYRRQINDVDYVAVSSRPAKKSDVIDGENLLKRIARQIKSFDKDAKIIVSSHNPNHKVDGCILYASETEDVYKRMYLYEKINEPTIFLYGDTYYEDNVIKQ